MKAKKGGPSRRILLQVPQDTLKADLDTFKQKALDLGASMAEIIPASLVDVDERVRLKCSVSLCPYYGKNLYCPPNGPEIELTRRAIARYNWAILYAIKVIPVEQFSDRSQRKGPSAYEWTKKSMEIAGEVETLAFGNGYYLAMALGQFSCLKALCKQEMCLVLEGKKCPYPLKARPSMEGMGIDVYGLVTKVGWEIYPIYRSVDPQAVPEALAVGIVFIH